VASIQLRSVRDPFSGAAIGHLAVEAITRAEAMGLLPGDQIISCLDLETFRRVLDQIGKAGIFKGAQIELAEGWARDARNLERLLARLNQALEDSPAPQHEWPRLTDVLGVELLARLLGLSVSSVRRYASQARATPDEVAGRLHFLALVVGDLASAYNDIGIRRWLERPRTALDGRAPAALLAGSWRPTDPGPSAVRELARALLAAPAT
jgi:hypothetical protein